MLGRIRTAVKYFAIGLGLGLFFAPRSGTESRRLLMARLGELSSQVLDQGLATARQYSARMQEEADRAARERGQSDQELQ